MKKHRKLSENEAINDKGILLDCDSYEMTEKYDRTDVMMANFPSFFVRTCVQRRETTGTQRAWR